MTAAGLLKTKLRCVDTAALRKEAAKGERVLWDVFSAR